MSLSGNSSLESAINWLLEHENDPDIDQLPLVGYFLIAQSLFVSKDLMWIILHPLDIVLNRAIL